MVSNNCAWACAGLLALTATVSLPLAAQAAPFAPIAMTPFEGTAPAPTLVQGEGRDSSASGAYRKYIPKLQSGQTSDQPDVNPQGAPKQQQLKGKNPSGGGAGVPAQSGQKKKKKVAPN